MFVLYLLFGHTNPDLPQYFIIDPSNLDHSHVLDFLHPINRTSLLFFPFFFFPLLFFSLILIPLLFIIEIWTNNGTVMKT